MDKVPFSVYDFFGALSGGFILLAAIAAAFTDSDAWQSTPSTVVGAILIVAAYCAGHVIANVSGYVLESRLVGNRLGAPTKVLFGERAQSRWRYVFPGYYKPLPAEQQRAVLAQAKRHGIEQPGEGLFYHCFARAKADEPTMLRLSTFLNLYGFARNMTVALLLAGIALVTGSLMGSAHTGSLVSPGWWAVGAFVGAFGLLYRYLKFFRHYAVEVFINYAENT